jgi:elongator complex protein 2
VLVGHEASINSLEWDPHSLTTGFPRLLSASTDSSTIIWSLMSFETGTSQTATSKGGLWTIFQRFGDVGGQRLGGFVSGLWGANGKEVMACGWNGSFRRWRKNDVQGDGMDEKWVEISGLTGHQGPVEGIAWSPESAYLLSTRSVSYPASRASYGGGSTLNGAVPIRRLGCTAQTLQQILGER